MAKKVRRGRPPLPSAEQRRHILSVRVRDETRVQLEKAALRSERSISQEVEAQIERSFERQGLYRDVLELRYGRSVAGLVMVLGETIHLALEALSFSLPSENEADQPAGSRPFDEEWLRDPAGYAAVVSCVVAMLEEFRPAADGKSDAAQVLKAKDISKFVTTPLVQALRGRVTGDNPLTRWAEATLPMLKGLAGPK